MSDDGSSHRSSDVEHRGEGRPAGAFKNVWSARRLYGCADRIERVPTTRSRVASRELVAA
jgi:hypothetical protein